MVAMTGTLRQVTDRSIFKILDLTLLRPQIARRYKLPSSATLNLFMRAPIDIKEDDNAGATSK